MQTFLTGTGPEVFFAAVSVQINSGQAICDFEINFCANNSDANTSRLESSTYDPQRIERVTWARVWILRALAQNLLLNDSYCESLRFIGQHNLDSVTYCQVRIRNGQAHVVTGNHINNTYLRLKIECFGFNLAAPESENENRIGGSEEFHTIIH